MYAIGDHVVKSVDGVCRIDNILHLNMSGIDKNKLYYLLTPIRDEAKKIYIPVDTADRTLRRAMTEESARQLIDRIPEIDEIGIDNEKLRELRYKEAIRSCNPEALVSIIKNIYLRKQKRVALGKKDTVIDSQYFQMAETNLYSELGFALHKDKSDICRIIKESIMLKEAGK
jgi:CarD family transcriptional regulator